MQQLVTDNISGISRQDWQVLHGFKWISAGYDWLITQVAKKMHNIGLTTHKPFKMCEVTLRKNEALVNGDAIPPVNFYLANAYRSSDILNSFSHLLLLRHKTSEI